MAIRWHVVAARDVERAEFERALTGIVVQPEGQPACQPFRFGSSGRWQWALASVWAIDGHRLDQALVTLPTVALRTTTCDGELWTLTVTGGQRELFRGVHFFLSVGRLSDPIDEQPAPPDSSEDEDFPDYLPDSVGGVSRYDEEVNYLWDEAEARREQAELAAEDIEREAAARNRFAEYGVVLPSAVLETLPHLPHEAAFNRGFQAHAEQIVGALAERGLEFDHDALQRLLTVGPLTECESDSDLGNLPRFLKLLGITGWIEDEPETEGVSQDSQGETDGVAVAELTESHEHIDAVQAVLGDRPLTPLRDGPLQISLLELGLLHRLSRYCNIDDLSTLIVLHPKGELSHLTDHWKYLGRRHTDIQRSGSRFLIGFDQPGYSYEPEDHEEMLKLPTLVALSKLPVGTRVELNQLVAGPRDVCHRYQGILQDGQFTLESTYPPLDTGTVREVLDLLSLTNGEKPIRLDSADEERLVRARYAEDVGERPRIKNGKVKAEPGERHLVVRCKFFSRFRERGVWDITGTEEREAANDAELNALMRGESLDESEGNESVDNPQASKLAQFVENMQRLRQAPHSDEILYKSENTTLYRASLLDLPDIKPELVEQRDREMADLGFQSAGDSVGKRVPEEVTRLYVGPANAVALVNHRMPAAQYALGPDGVVLDFSKGYLEFHTHFMDGSCLVTGSIEAASSLPKARIFVRNYEDLSTSDLWFKHLDGIQRLRQKRKTEPIDHHRYLNPTTCFAALDQVFTRYLKAMGQ